MKGFGGGSDCLSSVGACIGSRNISRIWASGSKGNDIAAEKMAVERPQPAKHGGHAETSNS